MQRQQYTRRTRLLALVLIAVTGLLWVWAIFSYQSTRPPGRLHNPFLQPIYASLQSTYKSQNDSYEYGTFLSPICSWWAWFSSESAPKSNWKRWLSLGLHFTLFLGGWLIIWFAIAYLMDDHFWTGLSIGTLGLSLVLVGLFFILHVATLAI